MCVCVCVCVYVCVCVCVCACLKGNKSNLFSCKDNKAEMVGVGIISFRIMVITLHVVVYIQQYQMGQVNKDLAVMIHRRDD